MGFWGVGPINNLIHFNTRYIFKEQIINRTNIDDNNKSTID